MIGNAVHVMRIATGEIEDTPSKTPARAKGGKIGGRQRALMRSISRVCDVSINTVSKLLVDAGKACAAFQKVRGVKAR